jgi:tryptophanyl-tRNA synthetase
MKRALSGIKPTGTPHLGNILGAIEPSIALQQSHENIYFVANYHALSTINDAQLLREQTYSVAAHLVALGLDPKKTLLFRQSDVPEVTELCWLLSSAVSLGDLTRAHAYKAAKDKGEEGRMNLSTLSYPVLMAADILLYGSDVVPVGKDQAQHLEMARAIAARFNHFYGPTLKEPKELIQPSVAVVPGIDGRKMSKSYQNGIEPLKPVKELKKQVMAIVTDSKGLEDKKDPSTCNIVALYKLVANHDEVAEMERRYVEGGYGYGHAKIALLEKLETRYGAARSKYEALMANRNELEEILRDGAARARIIARATLDRARKAAGL